MTNREIAERLESIEVKLSNITKAAEEPFDLAAAAAYLKMSKSHLYQLTRLGIIGHYKPGGKRIYFDKGDLDEYVRRNRIRSQFELESEVANRKSA